MLRLAQLLVAFVALAQCADMTGGAGASHIGVFMELTNPDGELLPSDLHRVFAATSIVALKHCSERNGVVTEALGPAEMAKCDGLEFTSSFFDTSRRPDRAVAEFMRISKVIDIVVGATYSSISTPLSTITSVMGRPSVSHFSSSPTLSDRQDGTSLFTRLVPSDLDAATTFGVLFNQIGATHAGMVYIDDSYGVGFRDAVDRDLKNRSIGFHSAGFQNSKDSIRLALQVLRAKKLNFIMVIAFDHHFVTILKCLEELGMFDGKIFLTADGFSGDILTDFGTKHEVGSERLGQIARQFVKIRTTGENKQVKQHVQLSSLWKSLSSPEYLDFINSKLPNDAGQIAPTFFAETQSLADAYAPFMYDAVTAACRALCKTADANSSKPGDSNGRQLYEQIITDQFQGTSGLVDINAETGSRLAHSGIFMVRAYDIDNTGALRLHDAAGWKQETWDIDQAVFPNIPDSVTFQEDFHYLLPGLKIASTVLAGLLVVLVLGVMVFTQKKRSHRIIARSQPELLLLFLLGVLISTLSIIFMGVENLEMSLSTKARDVSCMAVFWFWSIGTSLTFGALFVKLWRIWKIFENKALKKMAITNRYLYVILTAIVSVNVILLVTKTIVDPLKYSRDVYERDFFGNPINSYGTCSSTHGVVFIVLLISYQLLLFIAGVWVSYLVRNADSEYQESKYVTISLVSQFQLYLLGVPLVFVFSGENSTARFLVMFFVVWLNNLVLVVVIFFPKYMAMKSNFSHANSSYLQTHYSSSNKMAREKSSSSHNSPPDTGLTMADSTQDLKSCASSRLHQQMLSLTVHESGNSADPKEVNTKSVQAV